MALSLPQQRAAAPAAAQQRRPPAPARPTAAAAARDNAPSTSGRRGALISLLVAAPAAAGLLAPPRASAAPGNDAIRQQLRRLEKEAQLFGAYDGGLVDGLRAALTTARAQGQKADLLSSLAKYDDARMVLRSGAMSSLRKDLAFGQRDAGCARAARARSAAVLSHRRHSPPPLAARRRSPPRAEAAPPPSLSRKLAGW
jgi:hypothetical protein